jgi:hypothetical protein
MPIATDDVGPREQRATFMISPCCIGKMALQQSVETTRVQSGQDSAQHDTVTFSRQRVRSRRLQAAGIDQFTFSLLARVWHIISSGFLSCCATVQRGIPLPCDVTLAWYQLADTSEAPAPQSSAARALRPPIRLPSQLLDEAEVAACRVVLCAVCGLSYALSTCVYLKAGSAGALCTGEAV